MQAIAETSAVVSLSMRVVRIQMGSLDLRKTNYGHQE